MQKWCDPDHYCVCSPTCESVKMYTFQWDGSFLQRSLVDWTAFLLQKKRKESLTKRPTAVLTSAKNVQSNSVSFYCCFIALRQHPVFAMKTRCWNVTLLFVEVGVSGTQSSIRKWIPSRNTVKCWFKLYVECFVSSVGLKHMPNVCMYRAMYFFIVLFLASMKKFLVMVKRVSCTALQCPSRNTSVGH